MCSAILLCQKCKAFVIFVQCMAYLVVPWEMDAESTGRVTGGFITTLNPEIPDRTDDLELARGIDVKSPFF